MFLATLIDYYGRQTQVRQVWRPSLSGERTIVFLNHLNSHSDFEKKSFKLSENYIFTASVFAITKTEEHMSSFYKAKCFIILF